MTSHRHLRFRGRSRRGALLMFVLAMLAMFGLIGFTFIMMTSHARRGARAFARMDRNDDRPDELLHRSALQVFRGTNNRASVLGPHGLLEDLYGNAVAKGSVVPGSAVAVAQGQFVNVSVTGLTNLYRFPGRVLTVTTGPLSGRSFRILDQGTMPAPYLQLLNEGGRLNVAKFNTHTEASPFIINGAPFSGTGFGFDSAAVPAAGPALRQRETIYTDGGGVPVDGPTALLPNAKAHRVDNPSANEDYDAVDYQNMLLAMQLPTGQNDGISVPIPSLHRPSLVNYWMHQMASDPALFPTLSGTSGFNRVFRFIHSNTIPDPAERERVVDLKRKIMLRPLTEDHPNFDGGNPDFNPGANVFRGYNPLWDGRFVDAAGPAGFPDAVCDYRWDVDNDGDGVEDSIWVDLGLPVQQTEDGRLVKPLVAILCVDMDGRLNLNAHGNLHQANPENIPNYYSANIFGRIPRGQGYGPADVNLLPLFLDQYQSLPAGTPDRFNATSLADSLRDYRRIFLGNPAAAASDPFPDPVWALGNPKESPGFQSPGRYGSPGGTARPGVAGFDDYLSRNRWFAYATVPNPANLSLDPRAFFTGFNAPSSFNTSNSVLSGYGSPPDIQGNGAVAWNPMIGAPQYLNMGLAGDLEPVDDPYEINLNRSGGAHDAPFSPGDLEKLLCMYDATGVPEDGRLLSMTYNTSLGRSILADNRTEVTTESWDIPCPGLAVYDVSSGTKYSHVAELAIAKGCPPANLRQILSPEVRAGLRMNLNCAFGNGIDDNDNGVVDEPWEEVGGVTASIYTQASDASRVAQPLDFDNNGVSTTNADIDPRQYVARYLYILFTLVMGDWVDPAWADEYPGWSDAECRAHEMAQWAVNIVDFMDRDSIMTGFEYDRTPFVGGWNVDGDLSTNEGAHRGVVWGCERPELLISETLAFHDRRTEDTDADPSGKDVSDTDDPDETFDQKLRPQGSLFVELFNPTPPTATFAREFYEYDAAHSTWGINLRKTAGTSNSPIWRMAIVEADPDDTPATNDDDLDNPGIAKPDILRTVYFTPYAGTPQETAANVRVYSPQGGGNLPPLALLPPGRYAVVGPGDDPGRSTTYLGFRSYPTLPVESYVDNNARRIVLQPSNNPNAPNQVRVYSDGTNDDLNGLTISNPIAVVINPAPVAGSSNHLRMSISEPKDGYKPYTGPNQYSPPEDIPLDRSANGAPEVGPPAGGPGQHVIEMFEAVHTDGTTPRLRVIHLQRLANPLLPYNEHTNPYLTIDSMPVDLTSFNGVTAMDETPYGVASGDNAFYTRERGECEEGLPDRDPLGKPQNERKSYNWWPQQVNDSALTPFHGPTADAMPIGTSPVNGLGFFSARFAHTLGYLNEGYGPPSPGDPSNGIPAGYPRFGTPWLVWNNRPFASQYELLKVPAYRSSRVLAKAEIVKPLNQLTPPDPDDLVANRRPYGDPRHLADAPGGSNQAVLHDPYGHTLNFFYSDPNYAATRKTRELHRFLEFVHVPSRFTGTDIMLNPVAILGAGHSFNSPYNYISTYREPGRINLNTVFSENVWRGLTNFFPHGSPDPITGRSWQWNRFLRGRQGYESALEAMIDVGALNPSMANWNSTWLPLWKDALEESGENVGARPLRMDPRYPTRFAKPFRTSFGASLVPPIGANPATDPSLMPMREVEATLLRSGAGKVYHPVKDPTTGLTAADVEAHRELDFSKNPLFVFDAATSDFFFDPTLGPGSPFRSYLDESIRTSVPIGDQVNAIWNVKTSSPEDVTPRNRQTFITDFTDTMRHPYFRYQGLQRLGNVASTRSNVYAVWLTVGYFEVESRPNRTYADGTTDWSPQKYDDVYPDGYAIGKELGSDTGNTRRHRAFYLFDRSIPVGFERGKDHNVEDAILIRRFIE